MGCKWVYFLRAFEKGKVFGKGNPESRLLLPPGLCIIFENIRIET